MSGEFIEAEKGIWVLIDSAKGATIEKRAMIAGMLTGLAETMRTKAQEIVDENKRETEAFNRDLTLDMLNELDDDKLDKH